MTPALKWALLVSVFISMAGCEAEHHVAAPQNIDEAIRKMAASLPHRVDAATTVIGAQNDGQGGIAYTVSVDTSMTVPRTSSDLEHQLCDVRSDSPPMGNRNPFSGISYVYQDLQGRKLFEFHFHRGECPGQGL